MADSYTGGVLGPMSDFGYRLDSGSVLPQSLVDWLYQRGVYGQPPPADPTASDLNLGSAYGDQPAPAVPLPRARPPGLDTQAVAAAPIAAPQQPVETGPGPQSQPSMPPPPAGPNVGGNILAGFANLLNNPTLSGINDAVTGFTTGQRTDPVGAASQIREMTFRTLIANGVPQQQALLAATNPEAQKAVLAQLYPTYQAHVVGKSLVQTSPQRPGALPLYQDQETTVAPVGSGIYQSQGGPMVPPGFGGFPAAGVPRAGTLPPGAGVNLATARGLSEVKAPMSIAQQEQQKQLGEYYGKDYKTIADKATAATQGLNTLERMGQLSSQIMGGATAPWRLWATSALGTFFPQGWLPSSVKAGEEFNMLRSELTLEKLGGHLGAGISNSDAKRVDATTAGLENTGPGRLAMMDTTRLVMQRQQDILKLADQWLTTHPTMQGFQSYLGDWSKQNSLFGTTAPTTAPTPAQIQAELTRRQQQRAR